VGIDDAHQKLTAAIRELAGFLWEHRAGLQDAQPHVVDGLADRIRRINDNVTATARAHGYLHMIDADDPPDPDLETWGRRLNRHQLRTLGVVGLIADLHEPVIPEQVVADLAEYLAGPAVGGERMYVIDAGMPLNAPHEIAGWILARIDHGDLDALTPLPSAHRYADNPWDDALRNGGCVVLRRADPELEPRVSTLLPAELGTDLTETEVMLAAWAPLLLINLAAYDRVIVSAEYQIEPGRVVDRIRGTGLGLVDNGNGEVMWEEPAWGPYRPTREELTVMLQTVAALEPYLQAFQSWTHLTVKQGRDRLQKIEGRLRRSAHRLLALSTHLGVNGDVTRPRDRPEVTFWLISALEHLLVPDSGDGDLARRVAQRTAVLIGDGDADRVMIYQDVKTAYSIRSAVVHGSALKAQQTECLLELPRRLYGYLREVFRALVILGPQFSISDDCDEALLSQSVAQQRIHGLVRQVVSGLPEQSRSLRAQTYRARRSGSRRRRRRPA
jgi:hypothetical protein